MDHFWAKMGLTGRPTKLNNLSTELSAHSRETGIKTAMRIRVGGRRTFEVSTCPRGCLGLRTRYRGPRQWTDPRRKGKVLHPHPLGEEARRT